MNFTKIDPADLNYPHQELSNSGLGIVVALLGKLIFVGSYWTSNSTVI